MPSTLKTSSLAGNRSLAEDFDALYQRTRARMGDEDLVHIRNVAAYSKAIKARSRKLIQQGGSPEALRRGITLYMLNVLLEFSELGHAIMHGGYDHLPGCGEFHSERWVWDFVVDPREWKTMHHQNHHPFTNIVDKDHDLGYSFLRLKPGQPWLAHNLVQPVTLFLLMTIHTYYFSIVTATSAARTEKRPVLSRDTFRATWKLARQHMLKNYVREPLQARGRFLHTLIGNYLGTTLGYDLTFAILVLEHHASNVEIFHDPGPDESRDDWYRRQLLGTTNFQPWAELDAYFQRVLMEEVPFENRPGFEVFYGGLDTHLEHHLFPDLPPARQREISDEVRAIAAAHGLPYNTLPIRDIVPSMLVSALKWVFPIGERETGGGTPLWRRPAELWHRLRHGAAYEPQHTTYLAAPRWYNVPVKVVSATPQAGGQAHHFVLEKPEGWDDVQWDAGAFLSVRVPVGDESLVRQYSLIRDSAESGRHMEICVKRVADGRVSNHLNDALRSGRKITLVGAPSSSGEFILRDLPEKPLFLAGGVGITPIISMICKVRRLAPRTDAVLLYFNHDPGSILFEEELRELAASSGLRVRFVCGKDAGKHGDYLQGRLSPELLAAEVPDLTEREAYVCAPPGFIAAAREHLESLGLDPARFHTESFTPPTLQRPSDADAHHYRIHFAKSGKDVQINGGTTLLEAARQVGIKVPTGCERGLCKACVCTKLRGTTQHDDGAHTFLPRVTVCNSLPRSDIELDI